MAMQVLIPAGIALAMGGFFTAAWLRFSKPVRLMNGKQRITPQV